MTSIADTQDTSYNGWSNYPTWCVNLWLSNDEVLHRAAITLTRSVFSQDHPTSKCRTVEESLRCNVAGTLKTWVELDLSTDLDLSQVDWNRIADNWIEMAEEQ